jgi:hypothetical protein
LPDRRLESCRHLSLYSLSFGPDRGWIGTP